MLNLEKKPKILAIIFGSLISAAIMYAYITYAIPLIIENVPKLTEIKCIAIFIGYSIISYCVTPMPDYEDLGLFGMMMDNPFKISDNTNRFLLNLKILLFPGKLFLTPIINIIKLLKW